MHHRLAALALLAPLTLAACGTNAAPAPTTTPAPTSKPAPAPRPPKAAEINTQDRTSRTHKRRESEAMDSRPLLDRLPLTVGDVTISIQGLAPDGKTTLLRVDAGEGTAEHARAVYRDALHAYQDSGRAYKIEVVR